MKTCFCSALLLTALCLMLFTGCTSANALINKYGINPRTIHNLKHNKSITLYTLEKLCSVLDCQAESIVLFLPDKSE